MKRFMAKTLCLLAVGTGVGFGCGDDDPPKTPQTEVNVPHYFPPDETPAETPASGNALRLQFSGDAAIVVPMAQEGSSKIDMSSSFTVTLSGFKSAADADGVNLKITPVNGLRISQNGTGSFQGDTKTFVVTVQHDDQSPFSCKEETVHVEPDAVPAGYTYEDGRKSTKVFLKTGESTTCRIPVNQKNIQAFNRYARTSRGLTLHYELAENVTLPAPAAGQSNWTPIGIMNNDSYIFKGSFDGKNRTISNLKIDTGNDNQGLFGVIGNNAVVEKLGLKNVNISAGSTVGGVVGHIAGAIVRDCYVTGSVAGNWYVGGVVGYYERGRLENIYSEATVKGNGQEVGGIVGAISLGTVQNCYATGSVNGQYYVGGVAGIIKGNAGTVKNCYATGVVEGTGKGDSPYDQIGLGGVVGHTESNSTVTYSMALNPKFIYEPAPLANPGHVGRVIGFANDDRTNFADNYAFDGLKDRSGSTTWPNDEKKNGTNISAEELDKGTKIPDAFKGLPWTYEEGRLPGLFGQTVEMPEHLQLP